MKSLFYLVTLLVLLFTRPLMADTQQLLQLIDYVGVDYSGAIVNGDVASEAEYAEMLDFTAGITQQVVDLPEHEVKARLSEQ
ncbi:hypothetical protein MNBD_GAMMA11-975, partial [hydrothermal vent metagenome]